ncbi:MAG: extracellular solute-binding protein [Deltaproteobacteria bacterium]|nr:extracellular solute-binding protein [Deltaproteobacteria bacterium]
MGRILSLGFGLFLAIGVHAIATFNSLQAAESDPVLIGAQKEGELVTWAVGEIQFQTMVADRFKKKYPFIRKVNAIRMPSEKLRNRLLTEARTAKRSDVDVIGVSGFELFYLAEQGFFAPYASPETKAIPEGFKHPQGLWAAYYVNTVVTAFNTNLVAPADVPKAWEDLLHSKWRGKIAFFDEEYEWFASYLKAVGREKGLHFMRQFAKQDLQYRGGHTQMVQLLAAGEFPLLSVAWGPRVSVTKDRGAPVDWVALDPVFSNPVGMGMYKSAKNPNAAKLYLDFMLSREVQQEVWVNEAWKGSARKDVIPKDPRWKGVKVIPFDLNLAQKYEEIAKEFREVFLAGKVPSH